MILFVPIGIAALWRDTDPATVVSADDWRDASPMPHRAAPIRWNVPPARLIVATGREILARSRSRPA